MRLHYKKTGDGPPVIILHGLFGMLDNWQTFARHLSEDYAVYTPDLRNHGRSPHSDIFSYEAIATDVHEFIMEHGLGPVTLMGHSLGGKTAMLSALAWPEMVSKLIVVDIAPRAYAPGHDRIVEALLQTDLTVSSSRGEIEAILAAGVGSTGIARFLMKNLARNAHGGLYWRMNLPVLARDYLNTTVAISAPYPYDGPALFVRGEYSTYILDEDLPEIRTLFPASGLVTIPGAGHWVHADAMQALLDVTRRFLDDSAGDNG